MTERRDGQGIQAEIGVASMPTEKTQISVIVQGTEPVTVSAKGDRITILAKGIAEKTMLMTCCKTFASPIKIGR